MLLQLRCELRVDYGRGSLWLTVLQPSNDDAAIPNLVMNLGSLSSPGYISNRKGHSHGPCLSTKLGSTK